MTQDFGYTLRGRWQQAESIAYLAQNFFTLAGRLWNHGVQSRVSGKSPAEVGHKLPGRASPAGHAHSSSAPQRQGPAWPLGPQAFHARVAVVMVAGVQMVYEGRSGAAP